MIVDKLISWAVPFVCGSIITGLIAYIKAMRRKTSAIEEGVQCLLRLELVRSHEKYTKRGYCPIYAKESLKRAYNSYHTLDGNDVATDLYEETKALPTEAKEHKSEEKNDV